MHLYGNDINLETTPFDAGLGWLVHLEMPFNFIGRQALEKQAETGLKKKLVGIKVKDKGIARKGYTVLKDNLSIGQVTSGTWSPTLKEAIALAYVSSEHAQVNTELKVEIRGKEHPVLIVKKPFYRKSF